MNQYNHSPRFLRKRKSFLVLPLVFIPFITLAFWALGGGKGSGAQNGRFQQPKGINVELPSANLKDDKATDKMSYYEIAQADSAKIKSLINNAPGLRQQLEAVKGEDSTDLPGKHLTADDYGEDVNEEKVNKKLAQLNKALNQSSNSASLTYPERISNQFNAMPISSKVEDTDKLKSLMEQLNDKSHSSEDTEMRQLNGMLEKILDIQHPERVQERYDEKAKKHNEQILAVTKDAANVEVSLLKNQPPADESNGFFGWETAQTRVEENAIEAVVPETQKLVSGAVIKLRLLNDIFISDHLFHKGNFIYGTTSLNNERLIILLKSIRDAHSIFPVKMEVYDMDGLAGIYIPGAIARDVAKQSTDKAIQSLGLNSLDPSLGAQAASAGIEAAKTLLSKKVKLVSVTLKAGYRILIKNTNQ